MRTATDVTAYPAGLVGVNSNAIIVHCIFTWMKIFRIISETDFV